MVGDKIGAEFTTEEYADIIRKHTQIIEKWKPNSKFKLDCYGSFDKKQNDVFY